MWKDLNASGEFLEPPTAEKAYLNENNVLTLVYVVKMAVSKPFGYWEYHIDANTGRIISRKDRAIKEGKYKRACPAAPSLRRRRTRGPGGRAGEIQSAHEEHEPVDKKTAKVAAGKGLVFEPNPVSSLNDMGLQDTDPPAKFDRAYVEVTLAGLSEAGGKLNLQGPLVRIEDFEPGDGGVSRPPSTSTGTWTARRGDNAFNDVMTYFT